MQLMYAASHVFSWRKEGIVWWTLQKFASRNLSLFPEHPVYNGVEMFECRYMTNLTTPDLRGRDVHLQRFGRYKRCLCGVEEEDWLLARAGARSIDL